MHPKAKRFLALGAVVFGAASMMSGVSRADMWDNQRTESQEVVKGDTGSWDNIRKGLFADKEIADGTGVKHDGFTRSHGFDAADQVRP